MKKLNRLIFAVMTLLWCACANAAPFQGMAVVLETTGQPIMVPGDDHNISGDIDIDAKIMNVDPWGPFFGVTVYTNAVEILDPGTYSRDAGEVTVPPGHVGAHIEAQWGASTYYVYMVWQVVGTDYHIIDSDGDGFPGHAMNNGPFPGFTAYYEFTVEGESGPYVLLEVDTGGVNHECADGSAEVTMQAMPQLFGGAVLESVSWVIDGESAGTGLSLTESLALGSHTVEATALTTTGESASASSGIEVEDTTRPVVNVAFLDSLGNDVSSAAHGQVEISIEATDTCDPAPVITSSTATPTTQVSDGDVLQVNASLGNLRLPTTAINVSATARDASGNFSLVTEASSRTLVLE